MAVTSATPQTVVDEGITPTYVALTTTGRLFANGGKTIVHVVNASVDTTATIAILTPVTVGGLDLADQEVLVGPSASKFIGPFQIAYYNGKSGATRGKMTITSSLGSDVTMAILKIQ